MTIGYCPECGSRLQPHCALNVCIGSWCPRAVCGWDSATTCDQLLLATPAAPQTQPPSDIYPESVDLGSYPRLHLRPVLKMGTFHKPVIGPRQLVGWLFDHSSDNLFRGNWPPEMLHDFISTTLAGIRALPGPATW